MINQVLTLILSPAHTALICALLLSGWLGVALTAILKAGHPATQAKTGGSYWEKEEKRIRSQAAQAGVDWGSKETKAIWILSIATASGLYMLTGNLMLFGVGWLLLLVLPRLVINSRKHTQRIEALTSLTDSLRQLLARLPDQGSLIRAMEMVIEGDSRGEKTHILRQVLEELRLGSNTRDAIGLWQKKVGLKKFDCVAETLIQANMDGWTSEALNALDKSVQGLEGDLKAVLIVAQKAASRRRQLFYTLAVSWSFPLILSMMNTGQENIFLYSLPGKILIFSYVAISLFVIVKGQEYLSLNVEEL